MEPRCAERGGARRQRGGAALGVAPAGRLAAGPPAEPCGQFRDGGRGPAADHRADGAGCGRPAGAEAANGRLSQRGGHAGAALARGGTGAGRRADLQRYRRGIGRDPRRRGERPQPADCRNHQPARRSRAGGALRDAGVHQPPGGGRHAGPAAADGLSGRGAGDRALWRGGLQRGPWHVRPRAQRAAWRNTAGFEHRAGWPCLARHADAARRGRHAGAGRGGDAGEAGQSGRAPRQGLRRHVRRRRREARRRADRPDRCGGRLALCRGRADPQRCALCRRRPVPAGAVQDAGRRECCPHAEG